MIGSIMDQKLCPGWSPLAQQERLKMDKNHRFRLARAWMNSALVNSQLMPFDSVLDPHLM